MQKLGGRGWGILAGAIGGANKAYDEYAEKEVKKERAEALKEALGGMGYDKYSQFVDPTTGELNELGSSFLKSDLDQQEMAAKYAMLGDLEAMKRSGRLAADKELADYKHGLEYGGDMNLQNLKFEQQKELRRLFPSTGRSGGYGGKPDLPFDVKLNQDRAKKLGTQKNWEAYLGETGANMSLLNSGGIDRGAIQSMVGAGTAPAQWTNTVNQGEFKGRTALTPDAYLAAKAQGFNFPKGTKVGVSPEQARIIKARSQGVIPSAPIAPAMAGQSPVQPASFASWRKGQ
jgi:hypothetical protein